jgi:hypothetical protein
MTRESSRVYRIVLYVPTKHFSFVDWPFFFLSHSLTLSHSLLLLLFDSTTSMPGKYTYRMWQLIQLCLLCAPAALAAIHYAVPKSFAVMTSEAGCTLPEGFHLQHFAGESKDGGKTFDSLDFGFLDNSTSIATPCHFNSSSKAVGQPDRTPRYACDNSLIEFIWQNSSLTMIEGACPGTNGLVSDACVDYCGELSANVWSISSVHYEASGTVTITLICDAATSCGGRSMCKANATDIPGKYFSLEPTAA